MYDLYGNKPGGMMNVMTEEEDMSEAEDIHQKSESIAAPIATIIMQ